MNYIMVARVLPCWPRLPWCLVAMQSLISFFCVEKWPKIFNMKRWLTVVVCEILYALWFNSFCAVARQIGCLATVANEIICQEDSTSDIIDQFIWVWVFSSPLFSISSFLVCKWFPCSCKMQKKIYCMKKYSYLAYKSYDLSIQSEYCIMYKQQYKSTWKISLYTILRHLLLRVINIRLCCVVN